MRSMAGWCVLVAGVLVLGAGCGGGTEPECQSDDDCAVGSICEVGVCEQAVCPELSEPVCGVDGQTYDNACKARAAHVEVAHQGACTEVCGGIAGLPCPTGQVCELPAGECQTADLQGECVERPEVCTTDYVPVCGCDGVTYSNDCNRLMAGVQKDHDGECETAPES